MAVPKRWSHGWARGILPKPFPEGYGSPARFEPTNQSGARARFMSIRTVVVCLCAGAVLSLATPATAQSNRATGETYHVEVAANLWDPTPQILIRSESIRGIIGSD